MKKMWLMGFVLLLVSSAILVSVLQPAKAATLKKDDNEEKEEKKETVYTVELTTVEPMELNTFVVGTATLQAERQVDIFSKTVGQIESLPVEEGQAVKKGALLLALDGDDEQLQLDRARVMLNNAKAAYGRIEKSYQKELVSTEEFDVKKYEYDKARADYDLAAHKLEQTKVTAPFGGTIVARTVELGQTVRPSQKLFALASLDPLEADVFLPESQAADLKVGMPIMLSKRDDFKTPFQGRLLRISPVVDKETGTVKATLSIDGVPGDVRPGSYVHLRIVTRTWTAETVVPKKALVFDSRQTAFVYVARETEEDANVFQVTRVEVKTGIDEGDFISIEEGLERGDRIVLTGKESLKSGSKVKQSSQKQPAGEPVADNS